MKLGASDYIAKDEHNLTSAVMNSLQTVLRQPQYGGIAPSQKGH